MMYGPDSFTPEQVVIFMVTAALLLVLVLATHVLVGDDTEREHKAALKEIERQRRKQS